MYSNVRAEQNGFAIRMEHDFCGFCVLYLRAEFDTTTVHNRCYMVVHIKLPWSVCAVQSPLPIPITKHSALLAGYCTQWTKTKDVSWMSRLCTYSTVHNDRFILRQVRHYINSSHFTPKNFGWCVAAGVIICMVLVHSLLSCNVFGPKNHPS